ncbi:MAG: hypothetical protein WDW36_004897 [Sanguina aurantia]
MLCSISTVIHDSYLPVYVSEVMGLSNTKIGAVQGAAQFLCQISKGVSGVAGDLLGSQVRVLVFGTFLTLMCKPMFAALSSVYAVAGVSACLYWYFFAKLLDRMSKGIREAPTKAVMNELARESGDSPAAAYGLRQTLVTAGMLIGSSVASLTFAATGQNYILTFATATVFPVLALWWMVQNFKDELFGLKPAAKLPTLIIPPALTPLPILSPSISSGVTATPLVTTNLPPPPSAGSSIPSSSSSSSSGSPPSPLDSTLSSTDDASPIQDLPEVVNLNLWQKAVALFTAFRPCFWQALIVVSIMYFARFDVTFISLRAKSLMPKETLPMLMLTNTLVQFLLTAPLSKLSGTSVHTRNCLLWAGFGFMILANAAFGLPMFASPAGMFAGAALLGVHMALTHSITTSMVASYMPTGGDLLLGFSLAASNGVAAGVMLLLFSTFGDLGKDELVMRRAVKPKAA